MDNSPKYLFKIGQLEASLNDLAYDDIFLKERDPKKREQYIKNIIDTSTKAAEDYARRINLKENTMKKSELKMLIKEIVEQILSEKVTNHDWPDGTSFTIGDDDKVSRAVYKGKELDVDNWKYFDDFSMESFIAQGLEQKTKGKKLYRIAIDASGSKHIHIYPEIGIVYTTDTWD
jgi:hypothetical protein